MITDKVFDFDPSIKNFALRGMLDYIKDRIYAESFYLRLTDTEGQDYCKLYNKNDVVCLVEFEKVKEILEELWKENKETSHKK